MADTREVKLIKGEWVELSSVSCTFSSRTNFEYAQSVAEPNLTYGHDYNHDNVDPINWGLVAGEKLWARGIHHDGLVIVSEE